MNNNSVKLFIIMGFKMLLKMVILHSYSIFMTNLKIKMSLKTMRNIIINVYQNIY